MKLARAEKALPPHSQTVAIVAWIYAAILTVMAIAQLFAFEDFLPLMSGYLLPGGYGTASLVGGLIVFTEVFAVPFLLRMPLSPLMRWMSLTCGLVVPAIWLKLSVTGMAADSMVTNSGLLGTKVSIHAGLTALVVSIVLLVLAIWSVWGLWPVRKK